MRLRLIKDTEDEAMDKIEELYNSSFPFEERRDFYLVKQLLRKHPLFFIYIIEHEDRFIGFISCWRLSHCTFIEHFATACNERNKGYGQTSLQLLVKQEKSPFVLEVELPLDDFSKRRIAFYQRNGFQILKEPYAQPPYHPDGTLLPMHMMLWGEATDQLLFPFFLEEIYREVYHWSIKK